MIDSSPLLLYSITFFLLPSVGLLCLEEAELVGITQDQWEAMVAMEVFLYQETGHLMRSLKEVQLQLLLAHWRIPEVIVAGTNCYNFTGVEMMIVSLSKIATGLSWTQLCKDIFGGNSQIIESCIQVVYLPLIHQLLS
jgi:hypothetical protein